MPDPRIVPLTTEELRKHLVEELEANPFLHPPGVPEDEEDGPAPDPAPGG